MEWIKEMGEDRRRGEEGRGGFYGVLWLAAIWSVGLRRLDGL